MNAITRMLYNYFYYSLLIIISVISLSVSTVGESVTEPASVNGNIPHHDDQIRSIASNQHKEDLFSSTSTLEELVDKELQVVDLLDTFANFCTEKAQIIKSYVDNQKQLLLNGKKSKDIVAHPVEAYLLVRRMTADWDDVHIALYGISNYSQGVYSWIESYRENLNFPRVEDLNGVAHAIVRLQDTYQLDMASLAGGVVVNPHDPISNAVNKEFHSSKGLALSTRDLLFLGKHAFQQGLYNRAIEWLQQAQNMAISDNDTMLLLEEIRPSLKSAMEVHDDILDRQGPSGLNWKTNLVPFNVNLAQSPKYKTAALNKKMNDFVPKLFQRQAEDVESEHYIRLCRGEKLRDPTLENGLKCRVVSVGHPYLIISPLKVEEESHDPYIVVIHDFITIHQCEYLVQMGKPKLRTSMHQSVNGTFIASSVRTSKTAWIKDWDDPILQRITSRVEIATGLKASEPDEAEDYQIANYGLGGLYVPHTDNLMVNPDPQAYTPWEMYIGDRIATLMIYISDVDSGGATVFPRAGVTLWPKKGSAAFWWNLDRSGIGDENTRHGACPVLHGSKWVSNKWIRYNKQLHTAKCGLGSLDKFKRP